MSITNEDLKNRFKYHGVDPGQAERLGRLREAFLVLATLTRDLTPVSREQSTAMTHLETAAMWANAAIAREA